MKNVTVKVAFFIYAIIGMITYFEGGNQVEVIRKKIGDLIPYENNPRINDDAVKVVMKSISEFGFRIPIVIDMNNVIIAGHTRIIAAENLKIKEVPCLIANDLTPEQVKAFRLVDNKTSEFSTWDFEKLEKEMSELADLDFDMSSFGFFQTDDGYIEGFFIDEDSSTETNEKAVEKNKVLIEFSLNEQTIEEIETLLDKNGCDYKIVER